MREAHAAMDMVKRLKANDQAEEFKIEQMAEWKKALNRLAATPDGKLFIKVMLNHSGLFAQDDNALHAQQVVTRARSAFYRTWVRPHLDKSLRAEIE